MYINSVLYLGNRETLTTPRPSAPRPAALASDITAHNVRDITLQPVCGAPDPVGAAVADVGVDHCRLEIAVTQQLLHGADVRPGFQQMGRKRVPKGVGRDTLLDSRRQRGLADGPLGGGFVHVVPTESAAARIVGKPRSREQPLPRPGARRAGELSVERVGQRDTVVAFLKIVLVEDAAPIDVQREERPERGGQRGEAVLVDCAPSRCLSCVAGDTRAAVSHPRRAE